MKLYLAEYDALNGWKPMRDSNGKLSVFDTYESACMSIRFNKHKYDPDTDYKIISFVKE